MENQQFIKGLDDLPKLYSDQKIDKHLIPASKEYNNGNMEEILGVGLNMPFENTNSAARKLMFANQYQQKVCLVNPDYPLISTSYENLFGAHSSNFVKSDRDWHVLFKIEKFADYPGHHYYLIVIDDSNNLDVIERISYHHSTESYGFMYNNATIDSVSVGDTICKGRVIKKSRSFDDTNNYMTGKNLLVTYIADSDTTEDAIEISEHASKALARVDLKKVTIMINDNDIPLNLYGDDTIYKVMPDIGEKVKNGILCGTRIENKDEAFFNQAAQRLHYPMINDVTYKTKGTVIDIDIYCNKDISESSSINYERQLEYYINNNKRFCQEIVDCLKMYIDNSDYNKSYELSKLYTNCEKVLLGKKYCKDGDEFSNIVMDIIVYNEAPLEIGDKITCRYGGKGVVSRIVPDNEMARIHGTDKIIDIIWNQATCINRLNAGQLFELSINYISSQIVSMIDSSSACYENDYAGIREYVGIIYRFYKLLSDEYAESFLDYIKTECDNNQDIADVIYDMIDHENGSGLYVSLKPITESITFEKLIEIYGEYPYIAPSFLDVPITGTNGKIRFVQSMKPSIVASQYIYRMKQNAEEKHSATALSSVNVRNENTKSKAAKMYMRAHSNTPIRFGEMENNILLIMGAEIQVTNLMLYSTSPQGRREAKQLLVNEPYHINVELKDDAKSRSAEKLNAILKTMGVKFEFRKIKNEYVDITAGYIDNFVEGYIDNLINLNDCYIDNFIDGYIDNVVDLNDCFVDYDEI